MFRDLEILMKIFCRVIYVQCCGPFLLLEWSSGGPELRYPIVRIAYLKDCRPDRPVPYRPDRPVPYRPVLNIFQKIRECDFFEKLCVGKS